MFDGLTVRPLFAVTSPASDAVATTPFTFEVRILEAYPIEFELTVVVVEIEPPTLLVMTLPEDESVFGTEIESTTRLETVAFVIDAFVEKRFVEVALVRVALVPSIFVDKVLVATRFAKLAVPVAVMLVPVALSKIRLEI